MFRFTTAVIVTRLLAIASLLVTLAASAQDRSLGTFKDWSTMSFGDKNSLTCMAFTQPVNSDGDYTRRGDVFVFVTHRPSAGQLNHVSIEAGYTYDTAVAVKITIDSSTFDLGADGSAAWLTDPARGADLIAAMKAGRSMRVDGTSSRGTRTVDEFSLLGFTAAARAIDATCR